MENLRPSLDIVIPVHNEGENIREVLLSLLQAVRTPFRVLICYDREDDNTLPVVENLSDRKLDYLFVKNKGTGVHDAVMSGFEASSADAVLVMPADDTFNAGLIDQMFEKHREGHDMVVASRFAPGGCMKNCRWPKSFLVPLASLSLHRLAGLPVKDATNGFRLYSRRILERVLIESSVGFTHALEALVKFHRLGLRIAEVPALWYERKKGKSRFRLLQWLPHYLRWYFYGFATKYLRRPAESVRQRNLVVSTWGYMKSIGS